MLVNLLVQDYLSYLPLHHTLNLIKITAYIVFEEGV